MKIPAFVFLFLFPALLIGQSDYTGAAVSDSIFTALRTIDADTTIAKVRQDSIPEPLQCFYNETDSFFIFLRTVPGGQFMALSPFTGPTILKLSDSGFRRAWHQYEIDTWLAGVTGSKYSGFGFSGSDPSITCTITINADTFTGTAAKNIDALGLAFYHFLIDAAFATYVE